MAGEPGTVEVTVPVEETGLVVFDMYESAREKIESRGALDPAVRMVQECRNHGVPVFFTRPVHRRDGSDAALCRPDMGRDHKAHPWGTRTGPVEGDPGTYALKEFGRTERDYEITKHRWSAFYETALDLTLRRLGITTLIVFGGTAHIGLASTVYSARDRDYQIFVARDASHGEPEEFATLIDFIFPQVCHVRTVDEIMRLMS